VHSIRCFSASRCRPAVAAQVRAEPIPAPSYTPPPTGEKQPAVRMDDAGWRADAIVTRRADVEIVLGGTCPAAAVPAPALAMMCSRSSGPGRELVDPPRRPRGWLKKSDAVPLEEAVAYFSERIKRDPQSSYLYNKRARSGVSGAICKALDDFNTALRLDPYNVAPTPTRE